MARHRDHDPAILVGIAVPVVVWQGGAYRLGGHQYGSRNVVHPHPSRVTYIAERLSGPQKPHSSTWHQISTDVARMVRYLDQLRKMASARKSANTAWRVLVTAAITRLAMSVSAPTKKIISNTVRHPRCVRRYQTHNYDHGMVREGANERQSIVTHGQLPQPRCAKSTVLPSTVTTHPPSIGRKCPMACVDPGPIRLDGKNTLLQCAASPPHPSIGRSYLMPSGVTGQRVPKAEPRCWFPSAR